LHRFYLISRFSFSFGFAGGFFAGHVRKRKSGLKPATTAEFFSSPAAGLLKSFDRDTICGGEELL